MPLRNLPAKGPRRRADGDTELADPSLPDAGLRAGSGDRRRAMIPKTAAPAANEPAATAGSTVAGASVRVAFHSTAEVVCDLLGRGAVADRRAACAASGGDGADDSASAEPVACERSFTH